MFLMKFRVPTQKLQTQARSDNVTKAPTCGLFKGQSYWFALKLQPHSSHLWKQVFDGHAVFHMMQVFLLVED